jgi:hypothetical protein
MSSSLTNSAAGSHGARTALPVWVWLAVFALALALRVGVAVIDPPLFDGDQRAYVRLAESMAEGGGYILEGETHLTIHPLIPTLSAVLVPLTRGNPRAAGMAVAILAGALLPVMVGRVVQTILGPRFGLGAAILVAVHPHYILRSTMVEPDLLAALLGFYLVGLLRQRAAILAGAVLGLAYLNRPEWFLLLPVVVGFLVYRRTPWRRIAACVAVFLALSAVFLLFVRVESGRWALSGKDHWQYLLGVHQWRTGGQPLELAEIPELRRDVGTPWEHFRSRPREALAGYGYRWALLLRNLWRQVGILLLPFLATGTWYWWKTARSDLALLAMPLYLLPILAAVGTFYRHSIPSSVVMTAVAGVGVALAWGALFPRWAERLDGR